jgi:hypothetical protein
MSRMYDPSTGECRLVDDLDFSNATQTVRISLDGLYYQLDLSEGNIEELRTCLKPYIAVSHIVRRDDIRKSTPNPQDGSSS